MTPKAEPIFGRFWRAYGGGAAILQSPYLWSAAALSLACWGSWSAEGWWETVISVIPNLLGFTLGGFAIFVGFSDEKFTSSLAAEEPDPALPSVYREFCATFVHFIIVQVLALILAVLAKGLNFDAGLPEAVGKALAVGSVIWGWLCYTVFLYALTSVVAIALHVFRIANMYEQHRSFTDESDEDERIAKEQRDGNVLEMMSSQQRLLSTIIQDSTRPTAPELLPATNPKLRRSLASRLRDTKRR